MVVYGRSVKNDYERKTDAEKDGGNAENDDDDEETKKRKAIQRKMDSALKEYLGK